MRDEDDAALEVVERHRERLDRLDVEVVGGLVEEENVWRAPRELGKGEARLLPSGEYSDRIEREVAAQAKAAEVFARLLDRDALLGEVAHVHHARLLHVHLLYVMLCKLGDDELRMPADVPFGRLDRARQQVEEGALARAIRTHDRDAALAVDAKVAVAVESLAGLIAEGDIGD